MTYKGYTITADTRETVFSEYELDDWDMVGDEINVNDSADFEIVGYFISKYDTEGSVVFEKYFQSKEAVIQYIDEEGSAK